MRCTLRSPLSDLLYGYEMHVPNNRVPCHGASTVREFSLAVFLGYFCKMYVKALETEFCTLLNVLYSKQRSKSRVQDLLMSVKGSITDKLRLLGVYCLAARPSTAEVAELEEVLKQSATSSGVAGAEGLAMRGIGAIGYLRQQVSAHCKLHNVPNEEGG